MANEELKSTLDWLRQKLEYLKKRDKDLREDLEELFKLAKAKITPMTETIDREDIRYQLQELIRYKTNSEANKLGGFLRYIFALRFHMDYLSKWKCKGRYLYDIDALLLKTINLLFHFNMPISRMIR